VFGSDICTCRPYLIYGIEEAVKEAQKGGSGVVIYFRKEGRALGEVTKVFEYFCGLWVYNYPDAVDPSILIAIHNTHSTAALTPHLPNNFLTPPAFSLANSHPLSFITICV
jgi:hypothetical protein